MGRVASGFQQAFGVLVHGPLVGGQIGGRRMGRRDGTGDCSDAVFRTRHVEM